jgi:hypothetical protein
MRDVNEFLSNVGDMLPVEQALNLEEQRALPPQEFSFGLPVVKTGRAMERLLDLLDPMVKASLAKFENSDLARVRQRHRELREAALGEGIRRGA